VILGRVRSRTDRRHPFTDDARRVRHGAHPWIGRARERLELREGGAGEDRDQQCVRA
jgi:hypothetical protein